MAATCHRAAAQGASTSGAVVALALALALGWAGSAVGSSATVAGRGEAPTRLRERGAGGGARGPAERLDAPPVRATDLVRLAAVPAITVSRDGRRAVYVRRGIEPVEWRGEPVAPEYRSTLWMIDLVAEDAVPRQLTFGPGIDTDPVLAPDGRRVAFLRRGLPTPNSAGAPPQVHLLPLDGGESQPLTALVHGCGEPQWSPDGRMLAFSAPVDIAELPGEPAWAIGRPGRLWNDEPFTGTAAAPRGTVGSPDGDIVQRRAWLAANAAAGNPVVIDRVDFVDDSAIRDRLRFEQVHVVDLDELPQQPRRITGAFVDHVDPSFMPDGRSVVFAAKRGGGVHPDRVIEKELRVVPVGGGDERLLLAMEGFVLEQPRADPRGTHLGFLATRSDQPAFRHAVVGVVPIVAPMGPTESAGIAGGEPIFVTEGLDRTVVRWAWQPGGDGVFCVIPDRGGFPLLSVSPGALQPVEIAPGDDAGPVGIYAFGAGAGTIVCVRTTPQRPAVLLRIDARGTQEIIDLNPWTAERSVSVPIERWIDRPDGRRIQAFVMPPARIVPGRTAPVALMIHGGPAAMWGPGELTAWHELQHLAGRGFGVVYANPRGSTGYGEAFLRASLGDWGPGPAGDVLAALDDALRFEWADRRRVVIGGGSYGAYLTSFILARDQRFRAAVVDRGVYDLRTLFGEGSAWRLVEWAYGGSPFDARLRDRVDRDSPVNDAQRIRTPLLITHGDDDRRAGTAQAEMLFRALRFHDRPAELVRYPNADHDMHRRGDIRQRVDRVVRMVEFFERFVSGG